MSGPASGRPSGDQPARDALVVVNPAAGGSPGELADAVTDRLEYEGFEVRRLATADRGETVTAVCEAVSEAVSEGAGEVAGNEAGEGAGEVAGNEAGEAVGEGHGGGRELALVLAVGGDGTVRAVAEGIARGTGRWPGSTGAGQRYDPKAPALFVVPAGTGNSFYRALFADAPVEKAMGMALGPDRSGARRRRLDLGRLAELDRAVVLGASAGFLARVVDVARDIPEVPGRRRYEQAALELIGRPHELGSDVRVLVDGALLVSGHLLLGALGGARHRGGSFELLPDSVLDDGRLDVCAIEMPLPARIGELFLAVAEGRHLGQPEVTYARGHNVVIEANGDEPVPVECDGDLLPGALPPGRSITFDVVAGALAVWAGDPPPAG